MQSMKMVRTMASMAAMGLGWATMMAQTPPAAQAPAAPPAAVQAPAPQADAAPANPFPPVDPKNFTATTPTVDEVNSFLKEQFGFDDNRLWSVAAITPTRAPGVVKVQVYLADKGEPGKLQRAEFFVLPDGRHAISGEVIDFGAKPFEPARQTLAARATGPAEGAADKKLEIVEFADLQCPHCKEAQETMHSLAADFPQAHIVFENLPLTSVHPYAMRAALEGVCVRKAKGDAAFFKYEDAVFDKQTALTGPLVEQTLAAAVTAAGADPAAVKACAETQAAKDEVAASMQLAKDLGVESTPTLAVDGQLLPATGIPYDLLKRMIAYKAGEDGIVVHVQPTLSTLK